MSEKRITTDLNKPELLSAAQELEQEFNEAVEELESLQATVENLQEENNELNNEADSLNADLTALEIERDVLEARIGDLEVKLDEIGSESASSYEAKSPNVRLAIVNLIKFDERKGIQHLNQAERFIRGERRRLLG